MLLNLHSENVYGFWNFSLAHFHCLHSVDPWKTERSITWTVQREHGGRFRRTGASVTNSAGWRVCLAAGTSVRMLSVARFFYCHLFFVSIFGGCVPPDTATPVVKCCVVLCATFLHRVPMVTTHRVRLGTDSLAGEPECWWFSYWLVREKSLSHFFLFRTQNGILSNFVSTNTWTSYRWSWGHGVCHKLNWLDFSSNLELAMQDHRPVKIRTQCF